MDPPVDDPDQDKKRKPWVQRWWFWLIIVVIGCIGAGLLYLFIDFVNTRLKQINAPEGIPSEETITSEHNSEHSFKSVLTEAPDVQEEPIQTLQPPPPPPPPYMHTPGTKVPSTPITTHSIYFPHLSSSPIHPYKKFDQYKEELLKALISKCREGKEPLKMAAQSLYAILETDIDTMKRERGKMWNDIRQQLTILQKSLQHPLQFLETENAPADLTDTTLLKLFNVAKKLNTINRTEIKDCKEINKLLGTV